MWLYATVTSIVFIQAFSYPLGLYPPYTTESVDKVVNDTFDGIANLYQRAGALVIKHYEQFAIETKKVLHLISVSGDIDGSINRLNELKRKFLDDIDRIFDDTFLGIDQLINATDLKIDSAIQNSGDLPLVDKTLETMHSIAWSLQDWIRDYISRVKPVFRSIISHTIQAAVEAHAEIVKSGKLRIAHRHFERTLQCDFLQTKQLIETVRRNVLIAKNSETGVVRTFVPILLKAGNTVTGIKH